MRKLNHEKAYSADDIAWIRQAGFANGEDMIRYNSEQFGTKVEDPEIEPDMTLRTVIGAEARRPEDVTPVDPDTSAPREVDPAEPTGDSEPVADDDYDSWKRAELESEVVARNEMPDTTEVSVVGTGKDGNVLVSDLIKGLRLWDQENPGALGD
jgi:hypothetical protein